LIKLIIKRAAAIVTAAILLILGLCGCAERQYIDYQGFFFDTYVSIRIYGGNEDILDGAAELCREYDRIFSKTNPESDVWKLNNADGAPVEVSEDTVQIIEMARYYAELSDGKFDISCGSVTSLWDFKSDSPVLPEKAELIQALEYVGYDKIAINGCTVTLQKGTQIDIGGIAKGYIADKAAQYLRDNEIENAVINFGGNVVVIGDKFGDQFTIGIKSPFDDGNIDAVKVSDKSVVTAGTYQRGFTIDGIYYHHIINLSTGMPAESDISSVTVISDSSAEGDALATVLFLLGSESGVALVESLDGIEAVFICNNGNVIRTSGLGEK